MFPVSWRRSQTTTSWWTRFRPTRTPRASQRLTSKSTKKPLSLHYLQLIPPINTNLMEESYHFTHTMSPPFLEINLFMVLSRLLNFYIISVVSNDYTCIYICISVCSAAKVNKWCGNFSFSPCVFYRTDMFIHGEVINPFRIVSAAELLRYL